MVSGGEGGISGVGGGISGLESDSSGVGVRGGRGSYGMS